MSHFNKLSPAQAERLALLAEECAEVIQIVGKILRHGYSSCHPDGTGPNSRLLEVEAGHVLAALRLMVAEGDIEQTEVVSERNAKLRRVGKYLHHNTATDGIDAEPFHPRG